jgi:calcineurin-like phosphoesterase family protein
MLKKIKIDREKSSEDVIFFSDLHLGHDKPFVYCSRGFSTVQEHDDYLLSELWKVSKGKIAFNLGDSCLTKNQEENFDKLSEIQFDEHYHLWGNHPAGAKHIYKKMCPENEIYPLKYKNLTFCGDCIHATYESKHFIMSHFPSMIWEDCHLGSIQLSGHSHGNNKLALPEYEEGKILDVGVDVCLKTVGKPYFTLKQVLEIMDKKSIVVLDHHTQRMRNE